MRPIIIKIMPKGEPLRHGLVDVDDYYHDDADNLVVVASEQDDDRDTALILVHAFIEAVTNELMGITPEMVDRFDSSVQADESPGDIPGCPYFDAHQAAVIGERAVGICIRRVFS